MYVHLNEHLAKHLLLEQPDTLQVTLESSAASSSTMKSRSGALSQLV
jgi:hypothetical protein